MAWSMRLMYLTLQYVTFKGRSTFSPCFHAFFSFCFFCFLLILHSLCTKPTFYSLPKFFPLIPLPHLHPCHHNHCPSFHFHPSAPKAAAWSLSVHLLSRTTAAIPRNTKLRFGVHPIATSFSYLLAWLLWSLVLGEYLIFVDNLQFFNVVKIKELGLLFLCVLFGALGLGLATFLGGFWAFEFGFVN